MAAGRGIKVNPHAPTRCIDSTTFFDRAPRHFAHLKLNEAG